MAEIDTLQLSTQHPNSHMSNYNRKYINLHY